MINIILYNSDSSKRIANKAARFFSHYKSARITNDKIWLGGVYLKFSPKQIQINKYDACDISIDAISKCMDYMLTDEEIYISNNRGQKQYINKVNPSYPFESFLMEGENPCENN